MISYRKLKIGAGFLAALALGSFGLEGRVKAEEWNHKGYPVPDVSEGIYVPLETEVTKGSDGTKFRVKFYRNAILDGERVNVMVLKTMDGELFGYAIDKDIDGNFDYAITDYHHSNMFTARYDKIKFQLPEWVSNKK